MDYNFQIVLFKNKIKKKIINKFKTYKRALLQFETITGESKNVIFPVKFENGVSSIYELAILERKTKNDEKNFTQPPFPMKLTGCLLKRSK